MASIPVFPLPQDAFASGICCASDPGPLCPGTDNYRRPIDTLPITGPQCVCFSNTTVCNGIDRSQESVGVRTGNGGELVISCAGQEGQKMPYVDSIEVNGQGEIVMWAELSAVGGGEPHETIVSRHYKTTGVFNDSLAVDLNTAIQSLGASATGRDLSLNWVVSGGPTGLADIQFDIRGGICLRPRLLADGMPIEPTANSILTCIIGAATPIPLGGCPGFGIFGSAPKSSHVPIATLGAIFVASVWLHA